MYNDNGIYKWKYETNKKKEDAYISILQDLNEISPERFSQLSETDQIIHVNKLIKKIREINIFPVYYFNEDGIKDEIRAVRDKDIYFTDDKLITQSAQGLLLLDFLFPNLHLANAGNTDDNCVYNRFYDDDKLRKCLRSYMSNHTFANMRTPFFTYGRYIWNTATNFSPIRAKAIYERFCPKNGVILDYSSGYGGRMLGALSSKNNYTYYGIEPNTNTAYNLNRLGSYIKDTFNESNDRFKIFQTGSEDFCDENIKADFIFSCPPFYALERYTDEPTQSVVKYPQYALWLKHYARATIKNCRKMIKEDGLFGIDILDFYWKNKKYNLVRDWIKIIEEEGFEYLGKYQIVTRARKAKVEDNEEFLYLFKPSTGENTTKFYGDAASYAKAIDYKIPQKIAIYDSMGTLLNIAEDVNDTLQLYPECSNSGLRTVLKSEKIYKNKFFRYFNVDENPAENIEIEYLCEIDGIRFNKQVEVAAYCEVTRQAVSFAKKNHAKSIGGKKVIWK